MGQCKEPTVHHIIIHFRGRYFDLELRGSQPHLFPVLPPLCGDILGGVEKELEIIERCIYDFTWGVCAIATYYFKGGLYKWSA